MIEETFQKINYMDCQPSLSLEMEDGKWYLFCDYEMTKQQPYEVTHVTGKKGTTVTLSFKCDFDSEKPDRHKRPRINLTEVF